MSDKKGYCDTCEHPRPRNLYYDEDLGLWRYTQCTDRKEKALARDRRQDYKERCYHESTHYENW